MGNKQTISSLVTGGEASAGPPLGPALGPIGVNILQVIEAINEKTSEFKGMKIPVTVSVDSDTKKWEIEVGIPSASALLLKEAGIQKGSGTSGTEWVGEITVDSIVKVANVKLESSYATSLKSVAKQIVGTCGSLGIKIEGKTPKEFTAEVNEGKWTVNSRNFVLTKYWKLNRDFTVFYVFLLRYVGSLSVFCNSTKVSVFWIPSIFPIFSITTVCKSSRSLA